MPLHLSATIRRYQHHKDTQYSAQQQIHDLQDKEHRHLEKAMCILSKLENTNVLRWVKKLSQYLALLKRLTCQKSSKLCNNVKIIYVILYHLSSYINPRSCDLKRN